MAPLISTNSKRVPLPPSPGGSNCLLSDGFFSVKSVDPSTGLVDPCPSFSTQKTAITVKSIQDLRESLKVHVEMIFLPPSKADRPWLAHSGVLYYVRGELVTFDSLFLPSCLNIGIDVV